MLSFETFIQGLVNGFVVGSAYTLVALGLTMIFGVLRIPNFGHGNLVMLSAFVTLFISRGFCFSSVAVGYLGGTVTSLILISLVGIISYLIMFKPVRQAPPVNVLIIAVGLYFLLEAIAIFTTKGQTLWGSVPVPWHGSVSLLGATISKQEILLLCLTPLLILAVYYFAYRTKAGSAMRAVAQDPLAAALVGVNEEKVMLTTFGFASALAAIAGSVIGGVPGQAITPTMASMLTAKAFVVVILGGLGSMSGAIIGGYLLGIVESLGAALFQGYIPFLGKGYADAYSFIILLVLVIMKPEGLFGERG